MGRGLHVWRGTGWSTFRLLLWAMSRGDAGHADAEVSSRPVRRVLASLPLVAGVAFMLLVGGVMGTMSHDLVAGLRLTAAILVWMGLFSGMNQAANVLYYTSDIRYYLALPIDAGAIIWSRMLKFILPSFAGNFALMLSFVLAWVIAAGSGPLAIVLMTVAVLCVTLSSEFLVTMLVILLMRLSRFARDKDRFTKLFGIIEMVLTITFGMWLQPQLASPASLQQITLQVAVATMGAPAFLVVLGVFCPPILLAETLFSGSPSCALVSLGGMIALTLGMAITLWYVAAHLYLPGVRALGSVGTGLRKGTAFGESTRARVPDLEGLLKQRSQLRANLVRDWLQTVRTAYFFNKFILTQALAPLYFVCMMVLAATARLQGRDVIAVLGLLRTLFLGPQGLDLSILAVLGLVATTSFSTVTYMTAVSRDGRNFAYLRSLPMNWTAYLIGKLLPLLVLTALPLLIVLLVVFAVLGLPVARALYLALLFLLDATLVGTLTFGMGAWFPRLSWESEEQIMEVKTVVSYIIGGAFLVIVLIMPQAFLAIMHLCDVVILSPPFFAVAVLVIALAELTPVVLWVCIGCAHRLARRSVES